MGSSDSGQLLLTMKAYDKDFQTFKDPQPNPTAPPQTTKPADTHICAQAHIIEGVLLLFKRMNSYCHRLYRAISESSFLPKKSEYMMKRINEVKQNLWSLPRVQQLFDTIECKARLCLLPSLHPAEVVLGVHHVILSPFRKISPCSVGCHSPWDGCPSSHPTLAVCAEFSLHPRHRFVLHLPAAVMLF